MADKRKVVRVEGYTVPARRVGPYERGLPGHPIGITKKRRD